MRILVATTWFPSPGHPQVGAFVARDVAALAARHDVRVVHLVSPRLAEAVRSVPELGTLPGSPRPGAARASLGTETTQVLDFPGMDPVAIRVRRLVTDLRRPDHLVRAGRVVLSAAHGADVLHTAAFSTLVPLAGRRVRVPWVHTEHWHGVTSTAGDSLALRLATPPLRRLLLRPDVVTAVSELATSPIRSLRGSRPTVVVPCVVVPPARVPERPELPGEGPTARPLRIVAVGGLVPGKRPLLAVKTVAALREAGHPAELTWVGAGPLRRELATLAGRLGVEVRFTGAVDSAEVSAELAQADLFLLPTVRETFGVAIAEALAHGRPVVTGADGGFREFAPESVAAFVDSEEPGDWARAVLEVLERTRGRSAAEIAATIGSRFSPLHVRGGYEGTYGVAIERSRERAHGPVPGVRPITARRTERDSSQSEHEGPRVDVVVAVHNTARPVERAVLSVLDSRAPVRVTVVCHHVPQAAIAEKLRDLPARARVWGHEVRLVEHADGVPSPAGPFNKGLELASAEFVALLGSDDRLAPGAIDSWLALAKGADAVIARVAYAAPDGSERAVVPTPPARPGRRRDLDPVRDRLAYRSAPLGLLRRETLERLGLRHVEGQPVGEDLELSTRLWFEGERIAFDRRGPAYLVGEDASDRVTFTPRPLDGDLAWLPPFLTADWFARLPLASRRAIAVKLLRIHLFGAIHYRAEPSAWPEGERERLAELSRDVLEAAPGCERVLSRAERDLLDAALDPSAPAEQLAALSVRRRRHGSPATLVPRDLRQTFAREAPLRFMAASLLARL